MKILRIDRLRRLGKQADFEFGACVCGMKAWFTWLDENLFETHAVRDRLRTFAARLSGDSGRSRRASDTGIQLIRGPSRGPSGSRVSAVPMD